MITLDDVDTLSAEDLARSALRARCRRPNAWAIRTAIADLADAGRRMTGPGVEAKCRRARRFLRAMLPPGGRS